jgi:hypothetical protein
MLKMFGSIADVASDLTKIAFAPIAIAADLASVVTAPVAEAAEEVADAVREAAVNPESAASDGDPRA